MTTTVHISPSSGRPFVELDLRTDKTHRICVRNIKLHVILDIDPADIRNRDDLFTLEGEGGAKKYICALTVRDDSIPGNKTTELVYEHLLVDLKYTLTVDPGRNGKPYTIFEHVPCRDLITI